jgi:hypothetical protein
VFSSGSIASGSSRKRGVDPEVSVEVLLPRCLERAASLRLQGGGVVLLEESLELANSPRGVNKTEVVAAHEFGAVWF